MRKIILIVIGLLTVAYLTYSLAEIESVLATLRQSNPLYLLAIALAVGLLMANNAAAFFAIYRLVGLNAAPRHMFLMVMASNFVNVVAPSGGVGGMAVFIDEGRQTGQPAGRVMVAGALYLIYEYASLFAVLAAGFFFLLQRGQLNAVEITAASFLFILSASIAACLAVGYRSTTQLGNLLAWLARTTNRLMRGIFHRKLIKVNTAYTLTAEMAEGFIMLRTQRSQILRPLAFTLGNKLLLIVVLALSFQAMGFSAHVSTVVAGFSIGHLFYYASPTPAGMGFVDSILPVVLSSLDVPLASAVLVTLVYRAATFWLPLMLGGMAFRTLQGSWRAAVVPPVE